MKGKDKKSGAEVPFEEPSAVIEMDVVDFRRSPSPYLGPDQTDSVGTSDSHGSSDPNHLEIRRMELSRNSPVRLTKIYLDEVQESADLDGLHSHNEFFIIPKSKRANGDGLLKIANRDGNHIFSCSIRHMRNMLGCAKRQSPKPGKNGTGAVQQRRTKKKCDHSYRILDTQGLELVTGKLAGRAMEVRTSLKNSLGVARRNMWSNKFTVQPAFGQPWICRPSQGGCCGLCSCGVKSFQIVENGREIGVMKRDPQSNKFAITMPAGMTDANKGLILLTGLMIYDQYFSETSCCCNGVYNAKCCCCTIFTIIIAILFILLIVFLVLYFATDVFEKDSGGPMTASATDSTAQRNLQ